jgi:large subunit ribosomal protein L1
MPLIGKSLGVVLGPRGKMPIPLQPGKSVADVINSSKNSVRIRSKDKLTFHVAVGRRDMAVEKLADNIETVISRLEQSLEKGSQNIRSIYLTTTMGKSVKVM